MKKSVIHKKTVQIAIGVIAVFLIAVVCIALFGKGSFRLSINGEEVGEEEYLQAIGNVKTDVKGYFRTTYDSELKGDFWEEKYGDEFPYQKLADEAVEQLKTYHVIYEIAKEKGYIEDASFEGIKNRMEKENRERKETKAQGGIVYGITEFSLKQYMDYETGLLMEKYCGDEDNKDMNVSDEQLAAYYENGGAIIGEDGTAVPLEDTREALAGAIRQQRYTEMIQKKVGDCRVEADKDSLYAFTLNHI